MVTNESVYHPSVRTGGEEALTMIIGPDGRDKALELCGSFSVPQ